LLTDTVNIIAFWRKKIGSKLLLQYTGSNRDLACIVASLRCL